MKKSILLLAFFAAWAACTNPQPTSSATTKSAEPAADTLAAPKPEIADESPRPYFTGSGNEPGWRLSLQIGQDGSFPATLLADYGLDTLAGTLAKSTATAKPLAANQELLAGALKLRGKDVPVEALITRGKCNDDMSGLESEARLEIKLNGKSYRGCGNFAK